MATADETAATETFAVSRGRRDKSRDAVVALEHRVIQMTSSLGDLKDRVEAIGDRLLHRRSEEDDDELTGKMGRCHLLPLVGSLPTVLWIFLAFCFPGTIAGARKDIGFPQSRVCRNTVQGQYLLSDDNGYVCGALNIDSQSQCCPEKGEKFSCQGCNLVSNCCNSYEYCVSCCLDPSRTHKDLALKVKIAKAASAGTYPTVFDFCSGRCRHNSASVVHENAYASDFHHCFSLNSNSSGSTDLNSEARLTGINIITGNQGESCSIVCSSKGLSCVPSRLSLLNKCDVLQKYMSCKGGCFASIGSDQPAEVVEDAPKHANPGACLFTQREVLLSCDGSHQHTKRLCPCA